MSLQKPPSTAWNSQDIPFSGDRAAEEPVWVLLLNSELLWRTWDDESVVFSSASGQTHLLDALSAATLKEIERAPGTSPQLARRLADAYHVPIEDLTRRLPEILTRFETLGLAEPDRQ